MQFNPQPFAGAKKAHLTFELSNLIFSSRYLFFSKTGFQQLPAPSSNPIEKVEKADGFQPPAVSNSYGSRKFLSFCRS